MTSDAKLPIQTYSVSIGYASPECPAACFDGAGDDGDWCKADDVREMLKMQIAADGARGSMMIALRDRCCRAEAQRDRLVAVLRGLQETGLCIDQMAVVEKALADIDKENA